MPRTARSRNGHAAAPGFSFRWGIPVLDNLPFTVIYHFLLDHYAELGVDRLVVLCLAFSLDLLRTQLDLLETTVLEPARG